MTHYDCLVVGTGHAGAQVAMALRQQKFGGTIGLIGEETDLPYERPPLSKEYLAGERTFETLLLHRPEHWASRNIDLLLGLRAEQIDVEAHRVTCTGNRAFTYGSLVWAAGGRARSLGCPGHDLKGVHTIRTRADIDTLRQELAEATSVAIVGGGYIGLEAAAVLSGMGKNVTVLEVQERVLARVAAEPLSRFYEREHRAHGVNLKLRVEVERMVGSDGRVEGVVLKDQSVIPADIVIVGIGIVPAVQPLLDTGAVGGNGVEVDMFCRTSLADIFAVGDCALHANSFAGGRFLRLESVQNANDQATVAAKTIAGSPTPYHAVPWFWSKQFDLHLQTIGLSIGYDDIVTRGNPEMRSFSLIYLREGRVLALDCVNATKDYVQGRALIGKDALCLRGRLADTSVPLKSLSAA